MKRGRIITPIILVAALLLSGLTRDLALDRRGGSGNPNTAVSTNLSSMNSFALALLLGGLRGPLVMMLWSSSESQKTERNLEDFDTKVEWIRLLQPEFDSVHIFQIWNKAYNISVMMASVANKYITILDALDYAQRVNAQRPNDINIIYAIGGLYFDKFGNAQGEKNYYRKRVRDESRPHASRQKLARDDPGWRRLELDAVIDEKGNVLPQYLKPNGPLLVDPQNPQERYDGSELQFLKKYEPFPYGVSPYAFAFSYQKRCQVLEAIGKQRHAQLSPVVIDSRPPLTLKFWADEEIERARRLELQAYGKAIPVERADMELPTANISTDVPLAEPAVVTEAIYSLGRCAQLNRDSLAEFRRHIASPTYGLSINTYESQMKGIEGQVELAQADQAYLQSIVAAADQRAALRRTAAEHYRESIRIHQYVALRYYTDAPFVVPALPPGVTSVDQLKPEQYADVLRKSAEIRQRPSIYRDMQADDRGEFERYIERAETRLKRL